jgi:hypothetical protein
MTAEQVRIEQLQSEVERYRDRVRECEETITMLRGARRLIEYHRDAMLECYARRLADALSRCGRAEQVGTEGLHLMIREAQRDADYLVAAEVERMMLTKESE